MLLERCLAVDDPILDGLVDCFELAFCSAMPEPLVRLPYRINWCII